MSSVTRRTVLRATAVAALAGPSGTAAALAQPAQPFPNRQITFLVGFPPGGNIDYVARLLAREMSADLGQPVVVENRTGAGGNLATGAMVRAPADGHTLGFAAIHMATNPSLMAVPYDPVLDVAMVGQVSSVPIIVAVGGRTPYRTLADLVAAARERPGEIGFGHGGPGTSGNLAMEGLSRALGVRFLAVPFRGSAPITGAMLAGDIAGTFAVADATLPGLMESGQLRGLAVLQDSRLEALPGVPAVTELGHGPELFFRSWHGVMVRGGTPRPVVERLFASVSAAMRTPALQDGLRRAAIEPRASESPEAFDAYYRAEMARWAEVIRAAGIRAEG